MSQERRHRRYPIGSMAEFEVDGNHYTGVVSNSSIGGLLVDMEKDVPPKLRAGDTIDNILLSDIFSDRKCAYPAKVVRIISKQIAVEFLQPLSDYQKKFLDSWLRWQE